MSSYNSVAFCRTCENRDGTYKSNPSVLSVAPWAKKLYTHNKLELKQLASLPYYFNKLSGKGAENLSLGDSLKAYFLISILLKEEI